MMHGRKNIKMVMNVRVPFLEQLRNCQLLKRVRYIQLVSQFQILPFQTFNSHSARIMYISHLSYSGLINTSCRDLIHADRKHQD